MVSIDIKLAWDNEFFSNFYLTLTCHFFLQTVIDAHIFPALINILQTAEFRTRKEAAWAITNATSGGSAEQIKYEIVQVFQCSWVN